MQHLSHRIAVLAALCLGTASAETAFACATCGCSLSTDAAMGYTTDIGWRASLQYDDIDQSQLRHGARSISKAQVAAINDQGGDQEVEHDTHNRYVTFGLSYAPNADWNVRLLVPYVDRGHSTYASATNPVTDDQLSGASLKGLGDIRLIASFQGILAEKNLGVQFGIKLPTGRYGGPSADGSGTIGRHPIAFQSGPIAAAGSPDNLVDTSLQPGTGTTDVILGVYYHRPVSETVEAFADVQFQAAVSSRLHTPGEDFRVGNTTFVSVGVRYEAFQSVVPQLQINVAYKGADQGALADNPDSAGTIVYLSPGLTGMLAEHLQAFGFVQLPVYRNVIGYQLAPRWTASAGLSYTF